MPRRRFVILLAVSVALMAWAATALWQRETRRAYAVFIARSEFRIGAIAADLGETYRIGREQVLFLAHAAQVEELAELEQIFVALATASKDIYQLRLLDTAGRELVRVERGPNGVAAAPLQDKGGRYYVQAALELPAGSVYVSPLDLNVEHGVVERPLRPMLRFAAPLRHGAGPASGVVVVNRGASDLLARVASARGGVIGTLVLVDRTGTYVSHPDPGREWGARDMLDTGVGLADDAPRLVGWPDLGVRIASRRLDGMLVTGAQVDPSPRAPILLVRVPFRTALWQMADQLVPVAVALASAMLLVVAGLLFWHRQRRLDAELARETMLRGEISASEHALRQAQERLVATARLAALAESSATLAHELRNPLGAIVHSAALLRSDPSMDEDRRSLLEIVLAESERLERTVSDFLDAARRPEVRPQELSLCAIARDVVALARHEPAYADIGLEVECAEGTPPVVIDPDELRQVLWNLLLNAASATRRAGGKQVVVTIRSTELDDHPAVALEVRDEGDGIPAAEDRREKPGRAGIGLIVAAGIAARAGGTFTLSTHDSGRGACGRVVLPASSGSATSE